MKEKLAFCVLYALLIIFLTNVNCIKVTDDSENATTTTAASTSLLSIEKKDSSQSIEVTSERNSQEARIINNSDDDKLPGFSPPTTGHKIPPTLPNVKKVDAASGEKPEKSIKDIA